MPEMRRLSFEALDSHEAALIEAAYGRDCWPRLDWDTLTAVWRTTVVEFAGDDRLDQLRQLRRWAQTREQPIRNVRLERAVVPDPVWELDPLETEEPAP